MKPPSRNSVAGFTLIELIVIVVIVGTLSAIAAPSWLAFLNKQRLTTAQSEAVTAMREAQGNAKRQKRSWEVCFKDDSTKVTWTVRPTPNNNPPLDCATNAGLWKNLTESDAQKIRLDPVSTNIGVRFQSNGWLDPQAHQPPAGADTDIRQVTLMLRNQSGGSKRCVFVATMLGAIRTGSDTECN